MRPSISSLRLVTGAFGFTGRHIAQRLLARGLRVRTLTGHPQRPNPFGDRVEVFPFLWDDPAALAESLRGVEVLYNSYWIRFPHGTLTFERAVENSRRLFQAAREAGVRRIVHISVANPSLDSPLPYYRGKAQVEQALSESGLEYAFLRPTVLFGDEGLLINNIAWLLRRFPVFAIPGDGEYRLQPVYVGDLADLAVEVGEAAASPPAPLLAVEGSGARPPQGGGTAEGLPRPAWRPVLLDVAGPEVFTFNELVALVKRAVKSRAWVVHLPAWAVLKITGVMGTLLGDVLLTRHEIEGLRQDLLVSREEPTGETVFSEWLRDNAEWLGRQYLSEVKRHYR